MNIAAPAFQAPTTQGLLLDLRADLAAFTAFVRVQAAKPVRQGKEAPQTSAPPMVRATPLAPVLPLTNDPSLALPPGRPPHMIQVPRLCEADYVERLVDWLASRADEWEEATFRPYAGIAVRLQQEGNQLCQEGVPVLQRFPTLLLTLPEGKATSNRREARALCAVACRANGLRLYGRGKRD